MTKEDILKEAQRLKLSYDIADLGGVEYILFGDIGSDEDRSNYVRLMFYKGKWYGCHNGKVPKGSIDFAWIREALKELKKELA